jgi:hypothetical protein
MGMQSGLENPSIQGLPKTLYGVKSATCANIEPLSR